MLCNVLSHDIIRKYRLIPSDWLVILGMSKNVNLFKLHSQLPVTRTIIVHHRLLVSLHQQSGEKCKVLFCDIVGKLFFKCSIFTKRGILNVLVGYKIDL